MNIRVAIVEDNDSIRESLALILDGSPGLQCCGAWRTAEAALENLPRKPADVVLMDINLPGQSGIECVRRLKSVLPKLQIIMLTIEDDSRKVFESLKAGASGYLLKNLPPAQILEAVEEVHRGGSPMSSQIARLLVQQFQQSGRRNDEMAHLTPREEEVLSLAVKGYRSKEIADALSLSTQTVQTHFRNLYEKLHVRSRVEAVARYLGR
jgi:DNA-binding NarL/FixJ family response regulator